MRPRPAILLPQFPINIHTCEVQQRVLVVRSVIRLHLEVIPCYPIVSRIDKRFHRILVTEEALALVEGLLACWEITEKELGVGDGGEGEGVGFRDGSGRDRGAEGLVGCGYRVGGLQARVEGFEEFQGEVGFCSLV